MDLIPGLFRLRFVAAAVWLAFEPGVHMARAQADFGQIAARVADLLQHEHYNDLAINDKISQDLLRNYLEFLDPGRVYFLQGDIEFLEAKYEAQLDNLLMAGNISPAKEIYEIYERRVLDRVARVKKILAEEKFTFDSDRSMQITRKDLPWPATVEEADQLWHDLIEGELLQEVLRQEAAREQRAKKAVEGAKSPPSQETPPGADLEDPSATVELSKPEETPEEVVAKRYDRIQESLKENTEEDIAGYYLKALAHSFDPHSEYFTQSEYDNFRISMQKSLEGIGALLSMGEDGYAEIRGLVVSGPAHKGGELQVGDRIVSVAQGPRTQPQDIKGMKLQKVVDLIRGKRGTVVVLEVIPTGADPSERKIISIKRNKVDLKESLARAELILTRDAQGNPLRLGWIDLPSFYSDMETGETSVTKDTRRLLERLMAGGGMDGLILDLRDNGGGSLEEAINLTGLFIPKGPVVQSKDSQNNVEVKISRSSKPAYEGPLVVLTSKASASASEILAAALQDYRRAVIVGESSTFGKGTVQQLLPVTTNNFALLLPGPGNQAGALKLTIQKFYRIAGGSTQKKGVIPDIQLPSLTDAMEQGEASLKNSLPYDEIPSQRFALFTKEPFPIDELRRRSAERIAQDLDFQWLREEVDRYRKRQEANAISLNREVRKKEIADQEARDKARREQIRNHYSALKESEKGLFADYSLTLDNIGAQDLPLLSDVKAQDLSGMMTSKQDEEKTEEQKAMEPPHGFGHVKRETIEILKDLIELQRLTLSRKITLSEPAQAASSGKP